VVTLTMMPSAKPSTAPSAIVAPTLIRASLRAVSQRAGTLPLSNREPLPVRAVRVLGGNAIA
jgi:hypothetical protein